MCLFVWITSSRPLSPTTDAAVRVEAVDADAPIRAHRSLPSVVYVGAYEGCGCGFNADALTFDGYACCADGEALPTTSESDVDAAWFSRRLRRVEERVLLRVSSP